MSQVLLRLTGKLLTNAATTKAFHVSVYPETGYHPIIDGPVVLRRGITGVLNGLASIRLDNINLRGVDVIGEWLAYSFVGASAELDYRGTTYSLQVQEARYADGDVVVSFIDPVDVLNTDIDRTYITSGDDDGLMLPRLYGQAYNVSGVPRSRTALGQSTGIWVNDTSDWEATAQYHGGYSYDLTFSTGQVGNAWITDKDHIGEQGPGDWSLLAGDDPDLWDHGSDLLGGTGSPFLTFSPATFATAGRANRIRFGGSSVAMRAALYQLDDYDPKLNYVLQMTVDEQLSGWSPQPDSYSSWDFGYNETGAAQRLLANLASGASEERYLYDGTMQFEDAPNAGQLRLTINKSRHSCWLDVRVKIDKPVTVDIAEDDPLDCQARAVITRLIEEKIATADIGTILTDDDEEVITVASVFTYLARGGIHIVQRANVLQLLAEYFRCGYYYGFNRSGKFELRELTVPGSPSRTIDSAKIDGHSARQVPEIFSAVRVGYRENHTQLRASEFHRPTAPSYADVVDVDAVYLSERFARYAEATSSTAANFSETAYLPETFPSIYAQDGVLYFTTSGPVIDQRPTDTANRIIALWGVPRQIHTYEIVDEDLDFDVGDTLGISGYGDTRDDDYVVWGWRVECVSDRINVELLK